MKSTFCRIKHFMLLLELSQIFVKTTFGVSCFARISGVAFSKEQKTRTNKQCFSNTGASEKNNLETDNQTWKFSMMKHTHTH